MKEISQDNLHGHPRFYELLAEMARIHSAKNHDYAGVKNPLANLRECERICITCKSCGSSVQIPAYVGSFIRMMDKYMRILNFISSRSLEVKDESIQDAFKDLSIYSILTLILYEEDIK